jgi:ADP-ribosylglycohydrolase
VAADHHPEAALAAARAALEALSVGDALGETFFAPPEVATARIRRRETPPGPWRWTDDTLMACSVLEVAVRDGAIAPERLAEGFAARLDPSRGYGRSTRDLLERIRAGRAGPDAAAALFGGAGSHGNGAAMRVAPLGALWARDPGRAAEEADRSARATHTHPEGRAGAVAVAVAAALAARGGAGGIGRALLLGVLGRTPPGEVRRRIEIATALAPTTGSAHAAALLGAGEEASAADTVPFALWAAAGALGSVEVAFWRAVAGLGDRDTTCAIACGVVGAGGGAPALPAAWIAAREPLPTWVP